MRYGSLIAGAAGSVAIAYMLTQADAAATLAAAGQVGWAMLAVVAVRATIVVLAGLGWAGQRS